MKTLSDLIVNYFPFIFLMVLFFIALPFLVEGFAFTSGILFFIFYPLYFLTLKPIVWIVKSLFESRCPKCKKFFQREFVRGEFVDEKEIVRDIPRTESGVLYSNRLLEPDQRIEMTRTVPVKFIQRWSEDHYRCKNSLCGHEWVKASSVEFEASPTD